MEKYGKHNIKWKRYRVVVEPKTGITLKFPSNNIVINAYRDGDGTYKIYPLALKSDLPQFGLTPGIDCVSNTVTEFRVTFPKVFSKTPAVIVTPKSGAEGINGIPKYSVITVTTTGFMIRIYNDDSEQRSPEFYWIAMAQS